MSEDNSEKVTWWVGVTALLSLLVCCGLPLLVATVGVAGLAAGVKWGLAGLGIVGLAAAGLHVVRGATSRRHGEAGAASTAFHCCDGEPTVKVPQLQDPRTSTRSRR